MGNIDMQKSRRKHSNLFACANASDMEFIFSKKRKVIETFKAYQAVDCDNGDEKNIHNASLCVKIRTLLLIYQKQPLI